MVESGPWAYGPRTFIYGGTGTAPPATGGGEGAGTAPAFFYIGIGIASFIIPPPL